MRTIYHYPLCPFSRKVRLCLSEKKLDFHMEVENYWEKRPDLLRLNPAGQVPVLVDLNGAIINDDTAIIEYLEEVYPERPLITGGHRERAEIRRLVGWFDKKMYHEATYPLILEKVIKRFSKAYAGQGPNSLLIRQAKTAIPYHLEYIAWLIDRRNWLAGDDYTIADITAAAHISVLDYFGDIPWEKHTSVKDWYVRIKSRPTFRHIIQERLPGFPPVPHYIELDF
jgi:glutathione S-transferase